VAEEVMPCVKQPGSCVLLDVIKTAIDDYAEREMEHRNISGAPQDAGTHKPMMV
jgi:hypothetical protein